MLCVYVMCVCVCVRACVRVCVSVSIMAGEILYKPSEAATSKEKERPEQSCEYDSPAVEQSQVTTYYGVIMTAPSIYCLDHDPYIISTGG